MIGQTRIDENESLTRMEELRKKAEKGSKLELAGMAGILLLPIGLGLIFAGSRMREKANEEMDELYREAFIREPLSENFEIIDFRPYEGFSEEQVEGFCICDMGNMFDSEAYGKATLRDVRIETSDVTVQHYDRLAKKGNTQTLFKGRIVVLECPEEIPSSETVKERAGGILASLAERHKSVDMKVDGKKVILALNDGEGIPFYREKKKDISPEKELAKVYEDLDDIKTLVSMIA